MAARSQSKAPTAVSPIASTEATLAGFRALSDPLRLQVLEALRTEELCVCDLCSRLDVPQSKLSFHLKVLKEAGLLQARQEGRWMYYRLNLSTLIELERYLSEYRRFSPILPARPCQD